MWQKRIFHIITAIYVCTCYQYRYNVGFFYVGCMYAQCRSKHSEWKRLLAGTMYYVHCTPYAQHQLVTILYTNTHAHTFYRLVCTLYKLIHTKKWKQNIENYDRFCLKIMHNNEKDHLFIIKTNEHWTLNRVRQIQWIIQPKQQQNDSTLTWTCDIHDKWNRS